MEATLEEAWFGSSWLKEWTLISMATKSSCQKIHLLIESFLGSLIIWRIFLIFSNDTMFCNLSKWRAENYH
ncbi:hypothetical protein HYC85_025416 [Camellia sinensis]|uniref:Uncharacterized protein n=1 Tax=Camellia sinensis TaxID=4442 RepID=A0A7J7GAY9_CAMSI|nr:hypothetical protein HYC85_025416 [Camellia sinensis]